MNNKEFAQQLESRTRKFAVLIVRISMKLPNTSEGKVFKNQLTKSGTSIGANYREANRARSKADFINKIRISESESSETVYWLEIIDELNWIDKVDLVPVHDEAKEILAIFTSISRNSK